MADISNKKQAINFSIKNGVTPEEYEISYKEFHDNPKCRFSPAYSNCNARSVQSVIINKEIIPLCEAHSKERCTRCGKQAIKTCGHSSFLVCGAPLCQDCKCGH